MSSNSWHRSISWILPALLCAVLMLPVQAAEQARIASEAVQPQVPADGFGLVADVDGDGDLDTVVGHAQPEPLRGTVGWYENLDGEGELWTYHTVDAELHAGLSGLAADDLDADGDADLVASYPLTDELVWWQNHGENGWQRHQLSRGTDRLTTLEVRDVNTDGLIDIVARTEPHGDAAWWRNTGQASARWEQSRVFDESLLRNLEEPAQKGPIQPQDPTTTQTEACASVPSNLRAWYPFNESSGTVANDQGGSNDGTLTNGPTHVGGRVSNAVGLDGSNDFVNVPDNSALDFGSGDFSIEGWINTSDSNGVIAGKRQYTGGKYVGYIFMVYSGKLLLQIGDSTNSWSNYINYSSPSVNNGAWRHVAVTVDRSSSSGGKFYVDGSLVYTFNPTNRSGNTSNAAPLEMGRINSGSYLGGRLDEITLYSRVLTSSQVSAIRNAGASGKCGSPSPLQVSLTCYPQNPNGSSHGCNAFASGGAPPYFYSWSFGGSGYISGSGPSVTAVFSNCGFSGAFASVTVTVTDTGSGYAYTSAGVFCSG